MLEESDAKRLLRFRLENICQLILQQRWNDAQMELAAFITILNDSNAGMMISLFLLYFLRCESFDDDITKSEHAFKYGCSA
jgi:hypothetical protein